uniref:NADH dehydrogenase subunit 5 n=1 Tax=Ammophila clavus TaxID=2594619 RepID=UPI0030029DD4
MVKLVKMSFMFLNLFIFFFIMMMYFFMYNYVFLLEWSICMINSIDFNFVIYMDWKAWAFMFLVSFISFCVFIYSIEYMKGDKNINRFASLLFLFVISMYFMIMCPSLVSILLGWDGLGIISFLLVIYYQNKRSFDNGLITFIMNRVGDIGIMISIAMSCMYYGNFSWFMINLDSINDLIIWFLMGSAITKSAQFPFSSWLPAAMAAPTPVSALVHSSTLVTAGVYLMIRYGNFMTFGSSNYLFFVASLTSIMSGLLALMEYDLKKIIALSTLSQLGLMMVIVSLGQFMLAFFHLMTHAIFKSLLFLCAGKIIHYSYMNQDIRKYGCLLYVMPVTSVILFISLLSLMGFMFMSGFYSKDLILEYMFLDGSLFELFNMILMVLLTVMYSVRLMMFLLFNEILGVSCTCLRESNVMLFPMILLMFMSLFSGSLFYWMMFSLLNLGVVSWEVKVGILYMFILGVTLGKMIYGMEHIMLEYSWIYKFVYMNLCILDYCVYYFYEKGMNFGYYLYMSVEIGWVEYLLGKNFLTSIYLSLSRVKYDFNMFYFLLYFIMYLFLLLVYYIEF